MLSDKAQVVSKYRLKPNAARTGVAKHKVEHIEVLGAKDVAVAAAAVAVAVHNGSSRRGEHEHIDALGHVALAHKAPLH